MTDNGIGFDKPKSPTDFAPNGHFGLLGIHERVDLIGARLEIEFRQRKGNPADGPVVKRQVLNLQLRTNITQSHELGDVRHKQDGLGYFQQYGGEQHTAGWVRLHNSTI